MRGCLRDAQLLLRRPWALAERSKVQSVLGGLLDALPSTSITFAGFSCARWQLRSADLFRQSTPALQCMLQLAEKAERHAHRLAFAEASKGVQ